MAGISIKRRVKQIDSNYAATIGQAFNEFISAKEALNLSVSTIKNYRHSCDYFERFHNYSSDTPVKEITSNDIIQWANSMIKSGLKPAAINHYIRDVKVFLYWCMEKEYMQPFRIHSVEQQEEQLKLFSERELEALLHKPNRNDSFVVWRTWAIVNWILSTGNRAATVCDVKVGDVDYNLKEIALGHTKNKKAQIIPLSPALEAALKEYIRMWRMREDDDAWLFPNVGNEQLNTNALRQVFARYCNDRGVSKTTIHGLRHNFARGWIKNNGNVFSLQRILGHSSLEMTMHYVKLFNDDLKRDYEQYSPLDTIKRARCKAHVIKRR